MFISLFDIFSIGIGPSSSHTVGPMRAAQLFLSKLEQLASIDRIIVTLYGSLAFTGKGHGTDYAILMGLEGELPETINPDLLAPRCRHIIDNKILLLLQQHKINFDYANDLLFNTTIKLQHHSNGMRFQAFNGNNLIAEDTYYSVGGGFIQHEDEITTPTQQPNETTPYPFTSAAQLLALCKQHQLSIAQLMLANECVYQAESEVRQGILTIAKVMRQCVRKGCNTQGELGGGLNVKRRAPKLYAHLTEHLNKNDNASILYSWLNIYAMAVNEENAAGGRVVTAPTNGAAGIIPSVLNYFLNFMPNQGNDDIVDFLLTAAAIGILYKTNASISGAEMGCQGEVGVACSMAAGALAAVLGGNVLQVENAAEIGMEHNLGLTCDPVGGLVQIPCIERNAMGAVKAVNAAQLALAEDGKHKVTLDMVIKTMREIGTNMNSIYKETSQGGLAVNVIEC